MKSLNLFFNALTQRSDKQRLIQFKPPALPSCQYSRVVDIDAGHYHQYCDLVKWSPADSLHPCYLQMLSLPLQLQCLTTVNSPFPVMGLIHKANQIIQHERADTKAPFVLYARYHAARAHSKGWVIDIEVTAQQRQQTVYRAVGSYLVKAKAPHVDIKARQRSPMPFILPETAQELNALIACKDIGRKYARVSNDYNPIHLSRSSAMLFGFKQAIAHGMWTLAHTWSSLPEVNSPGNSGSANIKCEFIKPVPLPGTARCFYSNEASTTDFWLANNSLTSPHIIGKIG